MEAEQASEMLCFSLPGRLCPARGLPPSVQLHTTDFIITGSLSPDLIEVNCFFPRTYEHTFGSCRQPGALHLQKAFL